MTDQLDLDALQRLCDAATEDPWIYDSYSHVYSQPKITPYDQWSDPLLDSGHTLERYGWCDACEARPLPEGRSPQLGPGCRYGGEDYRRDPLVARVPASAGDSAHGNHQADAEFIAVSRTAIPALIDWVWRLEQENRQLRRVAQLTDAQLLAFWDQEIRPILGDLPDDGVQHLRGRYVADVRANPQALQQLAQDS